MKNWKRFSVIGLVASLPLISAVAIAFPKVSAWHGTANAVSPGASDIYGTGGVSDWGLTCANCHIKAPGLINATVLPPGGWPKKNGLNSYVPDTSYLVTVSLVGEHLAANAPAPAYNNLNSFALTAEDQNGKPQGVFTTDGTNPLFARSSNGPECLAKTAALPAGFWETQAPTTYTNNNTGTTFLVGDCHAIVNLTIPNRTNWTFTWKAPKVGTGPLTLYYGVVDGSSHGSNSQDDDVKMGTVKLVEGP
ncbi:MAG: hypothetical protein ABJE95_16695 [Byssovorax sp.]